MRSIAFAATVFALAGSAAACCMVPKDYAGRIGQSGQKALLIHDQGREELILGIDYRITPSSAAAEGNTKPDVSAAAAMPPNFVWVITVPSEPDHYAVADLALFDDLSKLTAELLPPPPRDNSGGRLVTASVPQGIELGKRVQVGPYDIQPVRARGREALEGLNTWLAANGFPTEDPGHMAYFVDRKFTFLCVKVKPAEGESGVRPGGAIPPLHLSFASERPYYPLKFSSRQGVFDVNLWVMTRGEGTLLKQSNNTELFDRLNGRLIVSTSLENSRLPERVRTILAEASINGSAAADKNDGRWNFALLRCDHVNQRVPISKWTEDVFLALK